MTLIKCPQCGQTVLSVASVCPKCSYLLLQHATPQGDDGGFVNCRRCGKVISATTADCEYCGYPQRFRRHVRRLFGAIGIVALVAIGIIVVRAVTGTGDDSDEPPTTPAVIVAAPQPAIAEPDSETTVTGVAPAADTITVEPQERPPVSAPTITRWTITWANVRDGRSTASDVVRILPPGVSVAVAEPAGGWWRVYERGEPIGFVAIDLLSARPPEP